MTVSTVPMPYVGVRFPVWTRTGPHGEMVSLMTREEIARLVEERVEVSK